MSYKPHIWYPSANSNTNSLTYEILLYKCDILCSPHEEAFEWIHIHSQDLHKYATRNLIPGGSEIGENLYIGRIRLNNETI
ncbi:hypothetical protein BDFB_011471, partial [Asbolus verrucosus]